MLTGNFMHRNWRAFWKQTRHSEIANEGVKMARNMLIKACIKSMPRHRLKDGQKNTNYWWTEDLPDFEQ